MCIKIYIFIPSIVIYTINTGNKNKLVVPNYRLAKVNNSFMGKGIRFYNTIPDVMSSLPMHRFKKHVKKTLMAKGYHTVEEDINDKNVWC